MDDPTSRRGMFRLGVVITAFTVIILSSGLTGPIEGIPLWWLLGLAWLGIAGIGLLFHAGFARVLGGLLLLLCGVLAPVSLLGALGRSPMPDANLMVMLSIANAIATTLLITWMCIRGIQMLLGRARHASAVTMRLVGAVLALVAANHLWLALQGDLEGTSFLSVHISAEGTQLEGFPFWPIWHVALLIVSLVMAAGPRRMFGHAATVLMLLFAGLVLLLTVAVIRTTFTAVELPILAMMLIPLYLCWWLRDELQRPCA